MKNKINILLRCLVVGSLLNNLIFSSSVEIKDILFLIPALVSIIYFICTYIYNPVTVRQQESVDFPREKLNDLLLSRQKNNNRGI